MLVEQGRLKEDAVWKMFELHMEFWEPTEKNIDSIAGKACERSEPGT